MALVLPENAAPPDDPIAARLEAVLATLPDEWLLLPGRDIPGGPRVGNALIHPEIGIALVDLAPASLRAAALALEEALLAEQILRRHDTLPVVTVELEPAQIPSVGDRLAAAFEAAPLCAMSDPGWPRRVIDLLLHATDAAMLPLPRGARVEPQSEPEPGEPIMPLLGPPDADERISMATPRRNAAMAAIAAAALLLAGGGGAFAYLALRAAPNDGATTVATLPVPDTPAPRAAAPMTPPNGPPQASTPAPAPVAAASATSSTPAPARAVPPVATPPAAPPSPPPSAPTDIVRADPAAPPPPPAPAPTAAPERTPAERQHKVTLLHKPAPKPRPELHRVVAAKPHKLSDRKVAAVEPPRSAAPPDEDNGPPIDPADLPPLAGSDVPRGSPLGLVSDAPFRGPPADGKPVMLLPPVAPPAAMPPPPASYGPAAGTLVGPAPR